MKKHILKIGALGTLIAPITTVIACNSDGDEMTLENTIVVQAETQWVPFYKQVINEFKAKEAKLMEDNGIKFIKIVEVGTFQVQETMTAKGLRDMDNPDVFLVPSDKFNVYEENGWLKPFKSSTFQEFLDAHLTNDEVAESDRKFEKSATFFPYKNSNGELMGVPENVEAMVEFFDKKSEGSTLLPITKFSDLWMSAGFFNVLDDKSTDSIDESRNLRDIVWFDVEDRKYKTVFNGDNEAKPNSTILSKADAETVLEDGFGKILDLIADKSINMDGFHATSATAAPIIRQFFFDHKTTASLYEGPWAIPDLKAGLGEGEEILAKSPQNWNQWGGGYSYSMNSRASDKKAKVMEELISYFYHTKFAKDMFQKISKLSPLVGGRKVLKEIADTTSITEAIYATSVLEKPIDPAFDVLNVWTAYANVIGANKQALRALKASDKAALLAKLKTEFMAAIVANVAAKNSENSI